MDKEPKHKQLYETDIPLDFGRRLIRVEGVVKDIYENDSVWLTIGSQMNGELISDHTETLSVTTARKLCDRLNQVIRG